MRKTEPGIRYLLYCMPADKDKWQLCGMNAWEAEPEEHTLAYMSVRGIRYRIDKVRGDYNPYLPDGGVEVLRSDVYEPDPELAERYKDYFLEGPI